MLRQTILHPHHIALGAKMGEFAGYDMPLFYKDGVLKEHEWTRSHCGAFDVSHMGQVTLEGEGAAEFLEWLTPSAFQDKEPGRAQYTVLMNEEGGIVDDLIVTRLAEKEFFIVLNAGCKEKDIAWIKSRLPKTLRLYHMEKQALIAVQGPWSERILHEIFDYDTTSLPYMHMVKIQTRYGIPVFLSRVGYTGEDGFEISLPNDEAAEIWEQLTGHAEAHAAGLAARDSLRLEMGYPLYGHDIDDTTSPVEAGLDWIIRKNNPDFIGAGRVLQERQNGTSRRRIGLRLLEQGIAREGAEIRNGHGEKLGLLTSGGFSPALKSGIGMGYLEKGPHAPGTMVFVNVRGRDIPAEISALPFVRPKTKSMKKTAA